MVTTHDHLSIFYRYLFTVLVAQFAALGSRLCPFGGFWFLYGFYKPTYVQNIKVQLDVVFMIC